MLNSVIRLKKFQWPKSLKKSIIKDKKTCQGCLDWIQIYLVIWHYIILKIKIVELCGNSKIKLIKQSISLEHFKGKISACLDLGMLVVCKSIGQ